MSNPAQEEADRLFSSKQHHSSHPEDRGEFDASSQLTDDSAPRSGTIRDSSYRNDEDPYDDDDSLNMSSTMTMPPSAAFHLPYTQFDANTGPKGVIADAQSFARAKQSTFRRAFTSITNSFSAKSQHEPVVVNEKGQASGSNSGSGSDLGDGDEQEEEFMRQWRAERYAELSAAGVAAANGTGARRHSPSKRTWGRLDDVDANGYLDAIEKVGDEVVVVVCIYDPQSHVSAEVEDTLSTLAYKYPTTRFVKLHHEIAEMTHIAVPAILAYNRGDVFVTISDAKAEGLEATLKRQRILT